MDATPNPTGPDTAARGILDTLARLPANTIVDEHGLARALNISTRSVPRWVAKGHLPAGAKLGSKTVWMAGQVLQHLASRLEQATKAAERRKAAQAT